MTNEPGTNKTGTLFKLQDGHTGVRFERHLNHSCETVWRALTDPSELQHWFPGIQLDAKPGGNFSIWFSDDCEGPAHIEGIVSVFEPPYVLAFGTMRYELNPKATGCVLVFTDVLDFNQKGTEASIINSVLGGWHKYLDTLEFALDGGSADPRALPEFDYASIPVTGRDQPFEQS